MTLQRRWMPSPNYSSRSGSSVRLIVVHTAEGARTIEELGNFFAKTSSGVSSHTGADDKKNVVGEYVKRGNKAWTQGNANPVAVSIELCAFAAWTRDEWMKHPNMLANCAQWIAEEASYFNLPIVALSPENAQKSGKGVCQHKDLGSWGGGHHDCGSGFPMDYVLDLAKGGGEEVGYPPWFWDWAHWYLNTSRDPKKRPAGAPQDIPDWAWDGLDEIKGVAKPYGMTSDERSWIEWYIGGKQGTRPDVYDTIPDHWWEDQKFVTKKVNEGV